MQLRMDGSFFLFFFLFSSEGGASEGVAEVSSLIN